MNKKYIIITGGVISGIGKGVTAAATGFFFSEDFSVVTTKLDGYLNIDPGTMNPVEHGEVFVLEDGAEVDMDFGHYERFIGIRCKKTQSITMGKVYASILERERRGAYLGRTVQMIPHVTDRIIEMIEDDTKSAQIHIIEIGGTVGDIEAELYFEAIRQLKQKIAPEDILHIHVTYIPVPGGVNEQKTKPTQQSLQLLQARGLFPDIIMARGSQALTASSHAKIALYSNLRPENIFSLPDTDSIYKIPEIVEKQQFLAAIQRKLNMYFPLPKKYKKWQETLATPKKQTLCVALLGKYMRLEDSYSSVIFALEHAAHSLGVQLDLQFISARETETAEKLHNIDACIIPGGFGTTGIETMLELITYLREQQIPTLGICLGMQLMVIEFMRNFGKKKEANSLEFDKNCKPYDVITLLESQKAIKTLGGTMRLGAQKSLLSQGIVYDLYKNAGRLTSNKCITERFRHRYEVHPETVKFLSTTPLQVSGVSEKEGITQFIEMDKSIHPFYVGTQSHPELTSKLENPAPLFIGLLKACLETSK